MADSSDDDQRGWEEACRREEALRRLLRRHPRRLSVVAVDEAADELGLSRATIYRLVQRYRATRTVSGLYGKSRGISKGARLLKPEQEAVIKEAIERLYLKPTRPPLSKVVEEIRGRCRQIGLSPPNWRTIKTRVVQISARVRAVRRGDVSLIEATTPTPNDYVAARPLSVVQIDHTRVDVIVVDEENRVAIDRPWITLAVDVRTRMVTGLHLSLDAPSRVSIGLCLLHSVFDKTSWLAERGISAPWPVAGLPEMLHADNGSDFRSRAFVRACRDEGIRITWRIPSKPHFGGHIERLIGTQMGAVHLLPGTTFSNPRERGDYQSAKSARMTLRELERWIGWEIAGHYHQRVHASLHRPPIAVWREEMARVRASPPRRSDEFLGLIPARGRARFAAGRNPFLLHSVLVGRAQRGSWSDKGTAPDQIRSARSVAYLRSPSVRWFCRGSLSRSEVAADYIVGAKSGGQATQGTRAQ